MKKVELDSICFGNGKSLPLIAGPCVVESESSALHHAEKIAEIAQSLKVPYIFKASYDKANRTSLKSFRGPGLKEGLRVLAKVKKTFQIPVLSDIHKEEEIGPASEVLDILQIPAFLSRQTDLLLAAGKSGRIVNLKKGQFLAPWDIENAVKKIESTGNSKILVTERGASFGYNNLVSDFRSIPIIQKLGYPVVFDATHSVQIPGGQGNASGGAPEFIPILARCAVAAGASGIFMEVHENPKEALSDGANSLPLSQLKALLQSLQGIHKVVQSADA